jgi:hypothetical protein
MLWLKSSLLLAELRRTELANSVVTSRVIDSDSSRYFQWLDSSLIRKMTRLESAAPNDSTRIRLADFCRKLWLQSTQLQLVQNKFIKIIVIVLLGTNNEPCEQWELRNFIRTEYMGICIEYIPDGLAYITYISVFRNNASATVFKMDSQNFLYLQYTNSDRLFSFFGTYEVLYNIISN